VTELRDDAFLLRAVDYRDHDRIVTLLTREHGAIGVMARGARRSRKRFGGALEPFQRVAITWKPGRGLGTLAEAVVRRSHPVLLGSLAKLRVAGEATAFVRMLCAEGQAEPVVFDELDRFFAHLGAPGETAVSSGAPPGSPSPWGSDVAALGLAFRMRLLGLFGASPELEVCGVSGLPCPDDRPAYFDPTRGTLVSRRHGGGPFLLAASTRARLRAAASEDWAEVGFSAEELEEATPAIDAFVREHVGARSHG
jgi:DNA repair protein RecO (recombination protein O)